MLITIILFVFGLCLGSFINALQYRIQIGKKNTGRSFCPRCRHKLAWYDLFPLVSWLVLQGQCRYCKKTISMQYPLIEFITGISFVAVGVKSGYIQKFIEYFLGNTFFSGQEFFIVSFSVICLLVIVGCFILIALHDYKTYYVLSKYIYLVIAASLGYLLLTYYGPWQIADIFYYLLPNIVSALVPALLFALIYTISRGKWLGAGDIEIAAMIGLFLGWPNILIAMYIAFITGALYGLWKIYLHKAKMKSEIPFGPFLISGTILAFIFGQQLFDIYVKIVLS